MFRVLPALLLVATQFSWAACDDSLPSTASRDDVLIIVNDNAVDSCEVGRYYAEQRNPGRSSILHVETPANPTISYVQYEILRDQILRELKQRIGVTPATWPTPDASALNKSCRQDYNDRTGPVMSRVGLQTRR